MSKNETTPLRLPRDLDVLQREAVTIALLYGGWAAHAEMEKLFARIMGDGT